MKLIVVRHGQTDANANKLLQGSRLNESLNKVGLQQIKELVSLLGDERINAIYSSELKRARETAEVIAKKFKLEIIFTDLLNEKDFGSLTGKTWDQIHIEYQNGKLKEIDRSHAYDYRAHGGESVDQVRKRIGVFLDQVKKNHSNQTVIAVTHSGIVKLLHHTLEVEQPPHIENASIHRFSL